LKSFVHVQGHPVHPALIPFPIAFLMGTAIIDLAAAVLSRPDWMAATRYLLPLGLVTGVLAAVPGALDLWKRVPPRSSGRARGIRHGIANASALLLFIGAWLLRRDSGVGAIAIGLELLGAAALGYGGWLGGVLVSRNLISVDHRQANAGKWQEARFTAPAGHPLVVGRADDLKDDQMKLLIVNGVRIALVRTRGRYVGIQDSCSHRGASLADGVCVAGSVQCLWHGSRFDAATGAVQCGPAKAAIRTYEVREQQGDVLLVSPPG
jgi:nitrite reductase/ring-hydroxylating ferredoxin subunit/uncharacterized membrane protein